MKLKGVTTSKESGDEVTTRHSPGLTTRLSLVILVVAYLSLALTFSLLTRAYEADDESAHTDYVEYIVQHHSLPHISVANGGESHQPPPLLSAGSRLATASGDSGIHPSARLRQGTNRAEPPGVVP